MTSPEAYSAQFKIFEQNLNGLKTSPVHQLRTNALHSFERLGFPTTKNEDWKYTNVAPMVKEGFEPVVEKTTLKEPPHFDNIFRMKANRLVFIDGSYDETHSEILDTKVDLVISPIANYLKSSDNNAVSFIGNVADTDKDGFTALNSSFFSNGAFISVPKNTVLNHPVLLYFISTSEQPGKVSMPRNIVVVGENSECSIIECYQNLSAGKSASNAVTEIVVKENAGVNYHKIQSRTDNHSHIGTTAIRQEKNSRLSSWTITFGGSLVRNNLNLLLDGENCESHLYGLYVVSDKDHVDNHVTVDHAKPNCRSNQLYKGLLNDSSTGVFCGRILVRQDAQKTNAFQSNKNILLSEQATVNSKPQLEIFADDVKCTHGSTSGQLDEDALYYIRSRGISEQHAKNILFHAFAMEAFDKIKNEELKEYLDYSLMIALNR